MKPSSLPSCLMDVPGVRTIVYVDPDYLMGDDAQALLAALRPVIAKLEGEPAAKVLDAFIARTR